MSEYSDGMILEGIETWQREIDEYKADVEESCEQYRNADTYGLDPDLFETQAEFMKAQATFIDENLKRKREEEQKQHEEALNRQRFEAKQREAELLSDTNIYTYCGVKLHFSEKPYYFRTEDETIKIGDKVIVAVGDNNRETEGIVVSAGQYARIGAPFPPEKTKFIVRKITSEESEN